MESYGWLGDGLLSFVVLGFAIWQWVSIRRTIAQRKARERETLRGPPDAL